MISLKDWSKLQAIIGKTGRESIKKRCEELDLDSVPLDIALGAKELLKTDSLDQCRMVSSGAATFYVWVGFIGLTWIYCLSASLSLSFLPLCSLSAYLCLLIHACLPAIL